MTSFKRFFHSLECPHVMNTVIVSVCMVWKGNANWVLEPSFAYTALPQPSSTERALAAYLKYLTSLLAFDTKCKEVSKHA
jgi:hypothetical protein